MNWQLLADNGSLYLILYIKHGRNYERAGADYNKQALIDFAESMFPGKAWRINDSKSGRVIARSSRKES